MNISFKDLMNNRNKTTDELKEAFTKLDSKKTFEREEDSRLWNLDLDEGGTGYALIRFLPPNEEDIKPPLKVVSYGFKGPVLADGTQKWYIENSLTTLGKTDPCKQYIDSLYALARSTGDKKYEDEAKKFKRTISYYANILVLDDPAKPENNGKVFIYKFGQKVLEKIKDKMFPEFKGDKSINVFDFIEGANFRLKLTEQKGAKDGQKWRNYDKCEFESSSPLLGGDLEQLEKVYNAQYKLSEFISPDQFKSEEELKARLDYVLGKSSTNPVTNIKTADISNALDNIKSDMESAEKRIGKPEPNIPQIDLSNDDDDEDMEFFRNLGKS